MYEGSSKSNVFFSVEIITDTGTCIIHQNIAVFLWITSLPLNTVTVSPNINVLPSNFELQHVSLPRKIFLTVLWVASSLWFLLPRHWHNFCLLNPLSWGWSDDRLNVLNLVSMEGVVKLSTQTKQLSLSFWCLCVVKHCHAVSGHYRQARFSAFRQ